MQPGEMLRVLHKAEDALPALLRDGVEDREYFHLLKQLTDQYAARARSDTDKALLARARELTEVPADLINTQFDFSRDVTKLMARRRAMAGMIEQLQQTLGAQ